MRLKIRHFVTRMLRGDQKKVSAEQNIACHSVGNPRLESLGYSQKSLRDYRKNEMLTGPNGLRHRKMAAFTLVEMVLAMGILGIAGIGICGAIAFLCNSVQFARENLRATQILAQTTEVIRLCNWDQTNPATNFIPTSLTVPYFTDNATVTNGPYYQLSVTITNPPSLGAFYSNDLRMVVVRATWASGRVTHTNSVSTYVSQYGLQNYVW